MSLAEVNPSIKALVVVVCVLLLAFVFDPLTPFMFLLFVTGMTLLFGNVPLKRWLIFFLPFLLIALAYVWTTALFPNETMTGDTTVLWSWGWIEITREGLYTGLALGLRVLCFASLSLMFILTTDATRFMFSLMQQCKLPPKIAYGILAGYRFLPLFKEELRVLQNAHRVRGVGRAKGVRERCKQIGCYAIPLLASAIRKAQRVAMAMESKGFTGSRERTVFHRMRVQPKDWFFLALIVGACCFFAFISWQLGYLRLL